MEKSSALSFDNVCYSPPNVEQNVLDDVNFCLKSGTLTLLVGRSGAGKSTLLKVARGIHKEMGGTFSGKIKIAGKDVTEETAATLSKQVAIVFQNPSYQLHQPRVVDEVLSAPMYQGLPWSDCLAKSEYSINRILGDICLTSNPADLSLGQQQRVALTASLAMEADILLLDEPFSYLDGESVKKLLKLLCELREIGKTIAIATHELDSVLSAADNILIMEQGRAVLSCSPNEFITNDKALAIVGEHQIINFSKEICTRKNILPRVLKWHEINSELITTSPKRASQVDENKKRSCRPILEIKNLSYKYSKGGFCLSNINLSIQPGEILGIVGHSGSGKSTLGRLLVNTLKPTDGSILIEQKNISNIKKVAGFIGYVTQNPSEMMFETTVFKECAFGPKQLRLNDADSRSRKVLEDFGLISHKNRDPRSLSGGEQRLLSIAAVLSLNPKIIILDEPEFGLDSITFSSVKEKIKEMKLSGVTIVIITHSLRTAAFYCDKLLLLSNGQQIAFENTACLLGKKNTFNKAGLFVCPHLSLLHHFSNDIDESEFIKSIVK